MGVQKIYAITSGNNPSRERLALALGADEVFSLKQGTERVTKRLQQENGGLGVDLCFEASEHIRQ